MASRRDSVRMLWLAAALGVLGLAYTGAGLYRLLGDVPGRLPVDLRLRWTESHLLVAGQNTQRVGHPDPLLPETHSAMRGWGGSYPPWSYAFGVLLAPPIEWQMARAWFASLNLLALAVVAHYGWQRARLLGPEPALVAAGLPFAVFPVAICLAYGQYGVVVAGLVVVAVRMLEQNRSLAAGIVLGLALVKPQLSAAYCVAMAASRRWAAVAGALVMLVGGTALMALAVGESPSAISSRSVVEIAYAHESHNPLMRLATSVLGYRFAVLMLGLTGAALTAWLTRLALGDPFRLACLAVIVAMFWAPRKHFDVVLMSLPLIWLWIETCRTRQALPTAMFVATGATLWLPIRDAQWDLWWVGAAQLVVWPAAAVLIARTDAPLTASPDPARRPAASA
jgi:hypothetical protein